MLHRILPRTLLTLSCFIAPRAFGFAEDQATIVVNGVPVSVSSHHTYLTRALAACAGVPPRRRAAR